MPDGQMKRHLDVSKARELIGFRAEVPLEDGIRRTPCTLGSRWRSASVRPCSSSWKRPTGTRLYM